MSSCSSASSCSDDLFILCPYWYCWVHPVYEADVQCAPTTVGVKTKCLQQNVHLRQQDCSQHCDTSATACCRQWTGRRDLRETRALTMASAGCSCCMEELTVMGEVIPVWVVCQGLVGPCMASDVALGQCLWVIGSALWASSQKASSSVTAGRAAMQTRCTCNNL